MSGNDGFLSRWSRRKHEAESGSDEPEAIPEDVSADAADAAAMAEMEGVEELSDAEILEKFDLKDPDELGPGDDFSGFMRAAIPEHLRRRALRTLWRSNPVLANLDGLNDYDGDWTGGSVAAGQLKTAYQVGMGFVRDIAETAGKLEQAADSVAADSEIEIETASGAAPQLAPEAAAVDVENAAETAGEPEEALENTRLSARKRMTFRVGDG